MHLHHAHETIAVPVFLRIPFLLIFPGVAFLTEGIDMTTHHDTASAESEALQAQALEAEAERKFDSLHDRLEASGRKREATASEEFRQWMQARARTDEAWGQWALAMDASRP